MAEKKFIKFYQVRPNKKNVNKYGKLNPETKLYPFYVDMYGYSDIPEKSVQEQFNKPIEYDNSTNVHDDRKYDYFDMNRDGEKFTVGPKVKRGFSVNTYVTDERRNKVGTDKGDIIFNHNDYNYDNYIIPDKRMSDDDKDEIDLYTKHSNERLEHKVDEHDRFRNRLANLLNNNDGLDDFDPVPLIVTADEDDIINYKDIRENNYSPARDSEHEVTIKKIDKREMPQQFKFNVKSIKEVKSIIEQNNRYIDKMNDRMSNVLEICKKIAKYNVEDITDEQQSEMDSLIEKAKNITSKVTNSAKTLSDRCLVYYNGVHSDEDADNLSETLEEQLNIFKLFISFCDDLYDTIPWMYEDRLNEFLHRFESEDFAKPFISDIKDSDDYFILNHDKIKKDDIEQYYPKDKIYSDESIKDVAQCLSDTKY